MPVSRLEDQVRAALRARAETETYDASFAGTTTARARRRLARNAIGIGLLAIALLFGTLGAFRSFARSEVGLPAATPTPVVAGPNGMIAFVQDRNIYTIGPDGSDERQLTLCQEATCGHIAGMAWSPDGSTLVFSRFIDKFDEPGPELGPLYLIGADGSKLRRITDCPAPECVDGSPAWSPDGTKIVFVREGASAGIFVVGVDGSNPTLIKAGSKVQRPMWSPDGSRISFDMWRDPPAVYTVNADGTGETLLAEGPQIGDTYEPVLSPDWSRIAYYSTATTGDGSAAELWVSDADGGHLRRIWTGPRFGWGAPAWSPNSNTIVFSVAPDQREVDAFVIGVDGSGVHPLGRSIATPIWSPDGTQIALVGSGLTVFQADGSGERTLVHPTRFQLAWQSRA